MSIQKITRRDGVRYRARVRVRGQQVSKVFKRRADAERWEREQLHERDNPTPPQLIPILFDELADRWLSHHINSRSASYQRSCRQILDTYLMPEFQDRVVQQITVQEVSDWFHWLQSEYSELAVSTCNEILSRLKTLFAWGQSRQLTPGNPAKPVSPIQADQNEDEEFHVWTRSEGERFLVWSREHKPWVYRLVLAALNTGMRLNELVGLQPDRLHLDRRLIHIHSIWDNKLGAIKDCTKSRKSRYVGINDELMEMFVECRLLVTGAEWVFCRDDGSRIPSNTFTKEVFRPACKRAGVPEIRFHDLRHTYAVHYMLNAGDIYDLQQILGHASIRTTEKYLRYAKRFADRLVVAAGTVGFSAQPAGQVTHLFSQQT